MGTRARFAVDANGGTVDEAEEFRLWTVNKRNEFVQFKALEGNTLTFGEYLLARIAFKGSK